eukprot:TRINITY_DN10247_c0_g1_i2.p1 TRINITY_DN10247_c0_g1~~TRINITY_DN10247_c0_g1_i2.p1  ORF type:complete len:664 (-),score=52.81 TRINITY_DN10247_c0_g1_i2:243-2234(-)
MGLKRNSYDSHSNFLPGCLLFAFCLFGVWLFAKSGQHPPPTVVVVEDTVDITEAEDAEAVEPRQAVFTEGDGSVGNPENFQPSDQPTRSDSSNEDSTQSANESTVETEQDEPEQTFEYPLCDTTSDFIPCLDNEKAIARLKSRHHYEHRERHCPTAEDEMSLQCVVPMPSGYKPHINWPESRDQIWYDNVPHPKLASYKADQNWVKPEGDKFVFPGGGTQFKYGATKYIEWLQEAVPVLSWGKHIRVALDMGCGVASFAAYLEPFSTRVMSVAPKDEHDAQIQFALERGVSALIGVMGTQRQPYPSNVFDIVHCARCRVPWHREGGKLLLELNRMIRPGGYFVWSATPVCPQCKAKEPDDKEIWDAMSELTTNMCWKVAAKEINMQFGVGVMVWQKPTNNECYDARPEGTIPPMCPEEDNADAAWYVPIQACMHRVPTKKATRGVGWPAEGKERLTAVPQWLAGVQRGIYGRKAAVEFEADKAHWLRAYRTYLTEMEIEWATVRNVMDMDAHYGGFGAALEASAKPVWTMNVVPTTSPDTLPIIFDRGLLGVYHDWCESFNTYPRTYDMLHADRLLGAYANSDKCGVPDVMLEMDRILRPMGYAIVREVDASHVKAIKGVARGMHWDLISSIQKHNETLLTFRKTMWRPDPAADSAAAKSSEE